MCRSFAVGLLGLLTWLGGGVSPAAERPNIVYILCDDLGYGDVHCLNPQRGKIATPHTDRLASEGMIFTDAHSGSSVCTPTRYGILTGRYCWRTKLQHGVLHGLSLALIAPDRLTVPGLLKEHGYQTACIGKWHLGMAMPVQPGSALSDDLESSGNIELDPAGAISDGPTSRGFDYYFGISGSLDMPPFAWIENDRFTQAPTARKKFLRTGPAAPDFEAVDVLPTLRRKAVEYITTSAARKQPFFLYLSLNAPHTPIVPSAAWQGKSSLGKYGDFVMQIDAVLGEVLAALDSADIAGNTLVMFTSDNGCSPAAGVGQLEAQGHFPSAEFRGYKADIWDGGHRIPLLVRWPSVIKPGSRCGQLTCLTDLMATCADMVGHRLPAGAGEDSVSILPLLRGEDKPVRATVVHHSIQGMFAIRQGPWKLVVGSGSGGWSRGGDGAAVQLYEMLQDVSEQRNRQADDPGRVARLTETLQKQISDGRSTPGEPRANDVDVSLEKSPAKGRPKREKQAGQARRPNILWLVAEDLGPHLGCYGAKEVWTPNLDRLAAAGVRYTHCYSGNVCSPSRSAFMTGMYATTLGAHHHRSHRQDGYRLPEGVRILTDWLRPAGYFTANIVKLPEACGFQGTGKTDWNFAYEGKPFDSADWNDLKSHQPFYAQINFQETHRKFHGPKRADLAKVEIPPYYPDHPVTRADWAAYLDDVSELDRKVGLVLRQLETDDLADDTVVVFFGDNGQAHVRGKQFCYEEGLLVPLVIRWPKQFPAPAWFQAGTVDDRLIEGIDLAPTTLAIANAPLPPKMQGRPLFAAAKPYVFGGRDRCDETRMRIRTVRDGRYRYIRNFTPETPLLAPNAYKERQYPVWNLLKELHAAGKLTPVQETLCRSKMPAEELYDLQADPWEIHDLAGTAEHQATLVRLRGVLERWIDDTADQGRVAESPEAALDNPKPPGKRPHAKPKSK